MRVRLSLDFDAGFVVAVFGAIYAAAVGVLRGILPGYISGIGLTILVGVFAVAGFTVGSLVAGTPDFGPTRRAALMRGFVATIPLYASGGLLFLPPDKWFSLIPLLSVAAAGIVGPPIGIFMFRLHRRRDPTEEPSEPGVQLAWLKGELVGSWLPLLISIAVLAALGVGMRTVPTASTTSSLSRRPRVRVINQLPGLYREVAADSADASPRYRLGVVLTSLGGFDDAVGHLTAALSLDSTRAEYWRALGRAAFFNREHPRSLEAYWNALRLDPAAIGEGGIDRVAFDAALELTLRPDEGRR